MVLTHTRIKMPIPVPPVQLTTDPPRVMLSTTAEKADTDITRIPTKELGPITQPEAERNEQISQMN